MPSKRMLRGIDHLDAAPCRPARCRRRTPCGRSRCRRRARAPRCAAAAGGRARRGSWRASTSLCALLRRTSASSSAWAEAMPEVRSVVMRSNWRSACSNAWAAARLADSAEASASRMAVSSRRTSRSPRRTASPFSRSTCSTTAETSARRSARRSGCTEPVIDRARGERAAADGDDVLGGEQQRLAGRGVGALLGRCRSLAAGGEGEGEGEGRDEAVRHGRASGCREMREGMPPRGSWPPEWDEMHDSRAEL